MTAPDTPLPFETTDDALLDGRLVLRQPRRGHRFGHDALLLAGMAGEGDRTLMDFGAGVGSAGLVALALHPGARAVLVEREADLAALAEQNAARNGFAERCAVVCADVCDLNRGRGPNVPPVDLVLANPPFNLSTAHRTSPDGGRARAHMADEGLFAHWVTAAARCLKPGGRLALILRPSELALLLTALSGRFGALELQPVHPRADRPAVRLLARAIKGRRTPPVFLPGLVLGGAEGGANGQGLPE
ncbi:tRNA1(Val) (adenine(37)-N6)-methyltransferase [Aquabacter cavernae]|uniref:tRNA1(Val) (adenine(37)-N6)-methyltransferase n=1 Tax=Aquabacter cavernae TaxID=2496029 RepID=UPI000F8E9232|nr:methyltransferase [Aquabacter cavernae]